MCVAYPGKVIEVKEHRAVVDFTGTRVDAATGIMEVKPGDRVLVHAGCIIQKLPPEEADEIESVFAELAALEAQDMAAIAERRKARGLSV